jgi:hypothetical protein
MTEAVSEHLEQANRVRMSLTQVRRRLEELREAASVVGDTAHLAKVERSMSNTDNMLDGLNAWEQRLQAVTFLPDGANDLDAFVRTVTSAIGLVDDGWVALRYLQGETQDEIGRDLAIADDRPIPKQPGRTVSYRLFGYTYQEGLNGIFGKISEITGLPLTQEQIKNLRDTAIFQ